MACASNHHVAAGAESKNSLHEHHHERNESDRDSITTYYPKIPASDQAQPITTETPTFRDIRISNVKGTATKAAGVIIGLPESLIQTWFSIASN